MRIKMTYLSSLTLLELTPVTGDKLSFHQVRSEAMLPLSSHVLRLCHRNVLRLTSLIFLVRNMAQRRLHHNLQPQFSDIVHMDKHQNGEPTENTMNWSTMQAHV